MAHQTSAMNCCSVRTDLLAWFGFFSVACRLEMTKTGFAESCARSHSTPVEGQTLPLKHGASVSSLERVQMIARNANCNIISFAISDVQPSAMCRNMRKTSR